MKINLRLSKKTNKIVFLITFFGVISQPINAQKQFVFGLECQTGNFWTGFLGYPLLLLNNLVGLPLGSESLTVRCTRIKNDGQKIDYYGNHFFGFRAEDLFRDFEYSLKMGWQPSQIPVGFYARVGFRHENFNTRFSETDSWTKHRLNCLRPGIGIRVSPLENMIEEYGWCPIAEIGSSYDLYLSYKGAYDNDKEQINNGVSFYISLGCKFENGAAVMLSFDRENYNLFNQNFQTHGGLKPYKDVETSHFNLGLSVSYAL